MPIPHHAIDGTCSPRATCDDRGPDRLRRHERYRRCDRRERQARYPRREVRGEHHAGEYATAVAPRVLRPQPANLVAMTQRTTTGRARPTRTRSGTTRSRAPAQPPRARAAPRTTPRPRRRRGARGRPVRAADRGPPSVVGRTRPVVSPAVLSDAEVSKRARRLAALIEPVVGQVYFSPECHEAYDALGFSPSPGEGGGVALPDGPAYFTSRGSALGQAPGHLVASAFAVFNPEIVVPCVEMGWSLTDAKTIAEARTPGRGRAARPHPRRASRRASSACSELLARSRRAAAPGGPAACTRGCWRSGCRARRGATSGGTATCCASSAATPTRRRGRAPGSTRPRSAC